MDTERVLALFAEANPVPDVDTVRSEFGASSADLTTLESRSRIMDTRHVDQLEPADSRQRRLNLGVGVRRRPGCGVRRGRRWRLADARGRGAGCRRAHDDGYPDHGRADDGGADHHGSA